ncbi:MAG: hypothetical protein AB1801_18345 [Chloroflexota bacterium]
MNDQSMIEVIDRTGWRKEYVLTKAIIYIGCDARNDIILEKERGSGVDPLHAQLIHLANGQGVRLVNLGSAGILLGAAGDQTLGPHSPMELVDGQILKLGEFTLIFHTGRAAPGATLPASAQQRLGLNLFLPQTRLAPHQSLEGMVLVRNLGDRSGVKFKVELEGLEPTCFEIEPGPILPSGGEKEVSFAIFHRGRQPLAGDYQLIFRVTAPTAYPAEQVTATQTIQVLPFYRHTLRLLSPEIAEAPRVVQAEPAAPVTAGVDLPAPPEDAEPLDRPETQPAAKPPATESAKVNRDRPAAAKKKRQTSPTLNQPAQARTPAVEPMPVVQGSPPAQDEAGQAAETETGAAPPHEPPATAQAAPAKSESAAVDDGWAATVEPVSPSLLGRRRVLKIKASPQQTPEPDQSASAQADSSSPTEDWWAEAEQ